MKTLAALLMLAAIGFLFAAGSYADNGPGDKTAGVTAPSTQAPPAPAKVRGACQG